VGLKYSERVSSETAQSVAVASEIPSTDQLYTASYYASNLGIPYERNEHWLRFFGTVGDRIVSSLAPSTALDVGCAFGFLVEALRDRGVDATGTDISEYAISQVGGSAVGHCRVESALEPIEGRYDLISCLEVVEHLSPEDGRSALANMTAATDQLLLSTTPADFNEPTHINVRPVEYWAEILAELGFFRDVDHDATYLTPWAGLFVRRDQPISTMVKDYERRSFLLQSEVFELRHAVLAHHAKIDALTAAPQVDGELAEARAKIERLERELWIARDAAVGAEASKGAATAQLRGVRSALEAAQAHQQMWDALITQLEGVNSEQLGRSLTELDRVRHRLHEVENSTTWKVGWKLLAPYRRLRGRG
jgi:SAM-dependent methyltransferase